MARTASRLFLLAAGLAAIALSCGKPELVDRRCGPAGECLSGFRCRQGLCILLRAEVCDGEDNDGDGLVDQDLYRATVRSVVSPEQMLLDADGGRPGTMPTPAVLTWSRSSFLAAWLQPQILPSWTLQYLLLDAGGAPLGTVQNAASIWSPEPSVLAVGPAPTGFLIAYTEQRAPRYSIKLVRVDFQGIASPPEVVSDAGLVASPTFYTIVGSNLSVGWSDNGPAVAILHAGPATSCDGPASCEPRGVFLARPGRPAERLSDSGSQVLSLALARGDGPLAIAWAECAPRAADGGGDGGAGNGEPLCPEGSLRAQVIVRGSGSPASIVLPKAGFPSLAWVGSSLLVVWLDLRDAAGPRLVLTPLGDSGRTRGPDFVIADDVPRLNANSLAPASGEAAVVWSAPIAQADRDGLHLARLDPQRGRIGRAISLDSRQQNFDWPLASAFFTGSGYTVWMGMQRVTLAEVRCSNEAPPADAGTDAGPPIEPGPCGASDVDGGATVSGRVTWLGRAPAGGIPVFVSGCRTHTEADGTFRAGGVVVPYDLTVVAPSGVSVHPYSYLSLSSLAPEIQIPFPGSRESQTSFRGTYAADGGSMDPRLHLVTPGQAREAWIDPGPFDVALGWLAPSPAQGQVLFLESAPNRSLWRYQYFGTKDLEDQAQIDLGTLSPEPLPTRAVNLRLSPGAVAGERRELLLTLGGEQIRLFPFVDLSGIPAPLLGDRLQGTVHVLMEVQAGESSALVSSSGISSSTSVLELPAPAAITVSVPATADGGVGPLPAIELPAVPGAGYYGAIVAQHILYGAAPPLKFPDLRPFGYGLVPGIEVQCQAFAHTGGPSFDDLLQSARPWDSSPEGYMGPNQAIHFSAPRPLVP